MVIQFKNMTTNSAKTRAQQHKEFFPVEWYDAKIVRYGNIDAAHPSHFLYAVNDCFQTFRGMKQSDRKDFIERQRKELSGKVRRDIWEKTVTSTILYEEYTRQFDSGLRDSGVLAKIIDHPKSFIPPLGQDEDVVGDRDHVQQIGSVVKEQFQKRLQALEKKEGRTIDEGKKQKCVQLFQQYHDRVLTRAMDALFERFKAGIADPLVSIDPVMMMNLLYPLDVNVIFIDKDIGMPVTIDADYSIFSMDRKSSQTVFLLYMYPFRFESLGLVENTATDAPRHLKIRKLFAHNHPFVQTAHQKL